jgi:hypothetical protein
LCTVMWVCCLVRDNGFGFSFAMDGGYFD